MPSSVGFRIHNLGVLFSALYLSEKSFMHIYETVTEALKDLKQRGFSTDFNLAFDKIKCSETGECLYPNQFEIVEYYRFEGDTDPSDEAVVYAIAKKGGELKGSLVSAYGAYSEELSEDLIKKLSIHP